MIQKLKTYLLFGNTYCGIEHHGESTIEAILLEKKKDKLELSESLHADTIEAIADALPKKQHAFLVINNNEVLSKHIESTTQDSKQLLYNAFPSVSINEFYYEIHSTGNHHLIAICRKSYVDELIETYQKNNINSIGFSLGQSMNAVISNFIKDTSYSTSNALLTKENDCITNIDFKENIPEKSYDINGLEVKNTQLLAVAGALAYILKSQQTTTNFEETTFGLQKGFKEKRFFSQFFMFGIGCILTLLLVNFFVFNSYFQEVEIMKETSQVNVMQKDKLLQLKASTDEKQKTVDDILKNATSRSSYYIDHISTALPRTIQLAELTYQPVTKRIKKNVPVQLQKNTLLIAGISTDSDIFSNWIQILENMDWISKVTVVINGTTAKNVVDFSLKIQINNE
ncbi:hypothetical protein [Kordia jejudonensis]|uniref:hypothetical protein n=1 Tax=Kordia jejudonensis TaxID=1348245 RepID=UPI000629A2EE|nr:hypothetical protein [Kordia jejudonensis]